MDKYFMWIHYERLHNHNKAKHNKTVCIFLGIYCMETQSWSSLCLQVSWHQVVPVQNEAEKLHSIHIMRENCYKFSINTFLGKIIRKCSLKYHIEIALEAPLQNTHQDLLALWDINTLTCQSQFVTYSPLFISGSRYHDCTWCYSDMEMISPLLALWVGNPQVSGGSPHNGPVMWSFDKPEQSVEQTICWWFERLWHCNELDHYNDCRNNSLISQSFFP